MVMGRKPNFTRKMRKVFASAGKRFLIIIPMTIPRPIIRNIKLVPQRGWKRLCFIAFSGVSSSPAS